MKEAPPTEEGTATELLPTGLSLRQALQTPTFWIFAGARTKGIRTVAAGDSMQFNSFRLLWGHEGEGLGWIYFPDVRENQHLRFSVVSGQSVDEVDPKYTKYWVELGAESEAGF